MHFPILKYQDSQNFKQQQITKLKSEVTELEESKEMSNNELEECLDIMQICISLILRHPIKNIQKMFNHHKIKLNNRGWKFLGYIALIIKKD